ncbi:MAG: phospholipid carrier-dependent glycosyltransferase [Gaiellales bacterium]|nr:MAG: phospholipid carrier-dependent glycosyltransferase [Gaiellales bacterium]
MDDDDTGTPRAWSGRGWLTRNADLILLTCVAAALRFFTLGRESLWYDELYVVWARKFPLGELLPEIFASEHPPAFNVIGYFWDYIGHGEFQVRALSALVGTATVLLAYQAAKELFARRAGMWAAAFTAVSPLLVWYSRDATSYSWVIVVSLASLWLLARASLRGGWGNWGAYTAVTAIAVFSHLTSGVLLVAEAVFFLLIRGKRGSGLKPWLACQALLLPALVLMLSTGKSLGRPLDTADPFSLQTAGKFLRGTGNAVYILLIGYTDQPLDSPAAVPFLSTNKLTLLVFTFILLAIPFASSRVRQAILTRRITALALFTTVLLTGPIAFLLLRDAAATGRYYAWAAPPLLILLAAVVAAAPRKVGAAAGSVAVAGLLFATIYDLSISHNEDWRSLMHTLEAESQPGDMVLCFPEHNCVVAADFYLDSDRYIYGGFINLVTPEIVYFGPPGVTWHGYRASYLFNGELYGLEGDEIRQRLDEELEGRDRFWYISGTGAVNHYPEVPLVEQALMEAGWRPVEVFADPLLVMKRYQRDA